MKDTLGVLLAGGAGERLFPLTRDRAKPAVPFGGNYRIIDITLSNCINSDLRRVYILTQYKALSLNRHIREGWTGIVAQELGEFIEILPPMQRVSANWYMGTADAVYQNIYSIGAEQPKHVLILSGDHIYKMNYGLMLDHHRDAGADVTLATLPIEPDEVSRFGVVEVSKTGEVIAFQEKPKTTTLRSPFNPTKVDASMGIYLFNTDVLLPALMKDAEDPNSKHDFGHNILPGILGAIRSPPITSSMRTSRTRSTGAMWGRSRLISTPTWMWRRYHQSSICMTRHGRCARGSGNIRRPSSSLANRDVRAWPSTRSSRPGALFPARWCATASYRRMCV
jgi:ADP-glucose pyrophosphorylase